jgi:hypothetical protein
MDALLRASSLPNSGPGDTRESAVRWPIWDIRLDGAPIANTLKEHGIEPAPERDAHPRWSRFVKAHWECLTATDFLSVEVCTIKGLVTYYILSCCLIEIPSTLMHSEGFSLARASKSSGCRRDRRIWMRSPNDSCAQ